MCEKVQIARHSVHDERQERRMPANTIILDPAVVGEHYDQRARNASSRHHQAQ
jgi:hypothetical protein